MPETLKYTPLWHKYRPAILKLMVDSGAEPQEYSLSAHEFAALNARPKGGHQFSLQVFNGKAINNIRESVVAKDLLSILQQSPKATELMETSSYEIRMDKKFILHVQKLETKTTEV